jgi:multiple sugar transport system permease protein
MRRKNPLYYIFLWFISLFSFLPLFWIILSSLKTKEQILSIPPVWKFQPVFQNFVTLFRIPDFLRQLTNSVVISVTAVSIALVVSFLASYSFSRLKPKGTSLIMFLLLSMRMVPSSAIVIPVFLMYSAFGWKGNYLGIILFYTVFSIPFSIWILKGFMDGVSTKFDETAIVNGGSRMHVIFGVILPQIKPGLVAAFVFNIIFVWNEFIFNFILGGRKTRTIPVALANGLHTASGLDWTFLASLTTVYIIPLLLFLFFFQKYLLVGMTFGTVRGEV